MRPAGTGRGRGDFAQRQRATGRDSRRHDALGFRRRASGSHARNAVFAGLVRRASAAGACVAKHRRERRLGSKTGPHAAGVRHVEGDVLHDAVWRSVGIAGGDLLQRVFASAHESPDEADDRNDGQPAERRAGFFGRLGAGAVRGGNCSASVDVHFHRAAIVFAGRVFVAVVAQRRCGAAVAVSVVVHHCDVARWEFCWARHWGRQSSNGCSPGISKIGSIIKRERPPAAGCCCFCHLPGC